MTYPRYIEYINVAILFKPKAVYSNNSTIQLTEQFHYNMPPKHQQNMWLNVGLKSNKKTPDYCLFFTSHYLCLRFQNSLCSHTLLTMLAHVILDPPFLPFLGAAYR